MRSDLPISIENYVSSLLRFTLLCHGLFKLWAPFVLKLDYFLSVRQQKKSITQKVDTQVLLPNHSWAPTRLLFFCLSKANRTESDKKKKLYLHFFNYLSQDIFKFFTSLQATIPPKFKRSNDTWILDWQVLLESLFVFFFGSDCSNHQHRKWLHSKTYSMAYLV